MKYIAILRGINVSGKNIIKMADLKANLLDNGFFKVTTYIQSGNLVFEYINKSHDAIASDISDLIAKHFGLIVPIIVFNQDQLEVIVTSNPYLMIEGYDNNKLYVTFMAYLPNDENVIKFNELSFLPDEFSIIEKVVYLYIPDGYGKTKLNNTFIERKLKIAATTRNWKTVLKLNEMIQE